MMKRMCVMLTLLAMVSTATAGTLAIIPPVVDGTNSVGWSLSSDGRYVAGSSYDGVAAFDRSIYYDGQTDTTMPDANTGRSGRFIGVDVDGGGNLVGVQRGSDGVGYVGASMHLSTSPRYVMRDSGGAASNVLATSDGSPAAVDSSMAGDVWMVGYNSKKYEAYIYKGTASGTVWGYITSSTGTGKGNLKAKSISKTSQYVHSGLTVPLIVGSDRGGVGTAGFTGKDRAIWTNVKAISSGNTSTAKPIPYFSDADAQSPPLNISQGYGISRDGTWMSGYAYKYLPTGAGTTGYRLTAFRYEYTGGGAGGAMEELHPVGFVDKESMRDMQAVGFATADDGTTVGYTWDTVNSYRAAIWEAGSQTGQELETWLNNNGVDTSAWGYLARAQDIVQVGNMYCITGYGYLPGGELRGFYVCVPEPATMAFLALGGLALLRRRR
jgi:hypothetical protein